MNADITWDQQYYYAVLNSGYNLTPHNLMDVITKADSNNFTYIPGGAIVSGKGKITAPSDANSARLSQRFKQVVIRIQQTYSKKINEFIYSRKINMEILSMAKASTDPAALDYVLIQPRTQ
ncbi:S-layer protein OS=Lysinibacillus sphaericus OX=1421 GN=ctc_8 PE=4 SV=1 [Lysinibacillus sphaericus]